MTLDDPDRDLADALRLRGDPPPATRISKRAVTVATGVAALSLGAVTVVALGPPRHAVQSSDIGGETAAGATTRPPGLSRLPKDYSLPPGVPRLGPPRAPVTGDARSSPAQGSAPPSDRAATLEAQRTTERRQALSSGLFGGLRSARGVLPGALDVRALPEPGKGAPQDGAYPAMETATLASGSVIRAALVTALQSDATGAVLAQVTDNLFDTATGRQVLIPQGSRLLGRYATSASRDAGSLALSWTRLVLPDGRAIALDGKAVTDVVGSAPFTRKTGARWRSMLAASLATFGLSAAAQLGRENSESAFVRAVRDATPDAATQVGAQVVGRALDTSTPVTAPAGLAVQVVLLQDLALSPWSGR